MDHNGLIYKIARRFSPRVWVGIAVVASVLAGGSAWVLVQQLNDQQKDRLVLAYESIMPFVRQTIQLTFHRDQKTNAQNLDFVYVAPVGLLDPKAEFNWISVFEDFVSLPGENVLPDPVAPLRLLDPSWAPSFNAPKDL